MSYWLWRGLLICLVLGTLQWGYAHPDSELTIKAKAEWAKLEAKVASYF